MSGEASVRPRLLKAPTGISGFDEVTCGGLPAGRPTLICGAAGCARLQPRRSRGRRKDRHRPRPRGAQRDRGDGEHDLEGLVIRLAYAVGSIGAKRVVLDTIETLFSGLNDAAILRSELRRLFCWLK